jgi:hypothetical protein
VASPSRVDMFGTQSQHLPAGIHRNAVVWSTFQACRAGRHASVSRPVLPYTAHPRYSTMAGRLMSDALLDACRQRRTPFATGIIAEAEPRLSIRRDSTYWEAAQSLANVGRFLIPVQQDQGGRRLPVLGPPGRTQVAVWTAEPDPSIRGSAVFQHVVGRRLRVR